MPIKYVNKCRCGCKTHIAVNRLFVSGHNLRVQVFTAEHRAKIGKAQKRAWDTKRTRKPIGSKNHDNNGYVRVKITTGAGWNTWRKEHILVIEQEIGRPLRKGEVVHHINGVRDDNRLENLYLCKDSSEHGRIHRSADTVLRKLMDEDVIRFNRETGEYERC